MALNSNRFLLQARNINHVLALIPQFVIVMALLCLVWIAEDY